MATEDHDLKVEEIFDLIMADKNWQKQEFAAYIGYDPSKMSQTFGKHWDKHWRVFIRLLPDLVRLKVIDINLLTTADNETQVTNDLSHSNKRKGHDNRGKNEPPITPIMSPFRNFSFLLQ